MTGLETFQRWVKDVVYPALPAGAVGKKHVRCPNHTAHKNGDRNPSFRISLDRDTVIGEPVCTCSDPTWHDVAGWLGVQSYDEYKANGAVAQVGDTKRAMTFDEYSKAHGVDKQVFVDAGWKYDQLQNRDCLLFPTANGTKARFLDGGSPSFRPVAKGYTACWYGLDRARKLANGSKPLVWCNGEPSVIVAQHFGIPAIATTGGEGNKFNDLATELPPDCAVWVVMDCDKAGQRAAGKAESALMELTTNVTIITLPLSDKGDLADFCKLHGKNTMSELMKLAKPKEQPAPEQKPEPIKEKLLSLSDVTGDVAKQLYDNIANPGAMRGLSFGLKLVDGMTRGARDGNVYTVLGAKGMGKSTLMCTMAGSFMEQAPGYLEPTELGVRLFTIKLACALSKVPFTKFDDGNMNPGELADFEAALELIHKRVIIAPPTTSTPKELYERIKDAKENKGIKWVMVDSLNKLRINGDNYFGEITSASGAIQSVAQELDLPVIVSSQIGRKDVDRTDKRPRSSDGKGSGQIEEDAALLLGMYYHEYYVRKGELQPHEKYPPGIAFLYNLKDRWRGLEGMEIPLRFIGGAAFTDITQGELDAERIKHGFKLDDSSSDDEPDDDDQPF